MNVYFGGQHTEVGKFELIVNGDTVKLNNWCGDGEQMFTVYNRFSDMEKVNDCDDNKEYKRHCGCFDGEIKIRDDWNDALVQFRGKAVVKLYHVARGRHAGDPIFYIFLQED